MILKSQAKKFYLTFSLLTIAVAIIAWRINPTFDRVDTLSYSSSGALTIPMQWENSLVKPSLTRDPIELFKDQSAHHLSAHETGWILKSDDTGKELWSFFAAEATEGFTETIARDSQSVYFLSRNAALYSFNDKTGAPRWIHNLGDKAGSDIFTVGRDFVVALARGNHTIVAKLESDSGKIIWKSQPLDIFPNDITFQTEGSELLISNASGNKVLLNLSDGSLR